MGGRCGGEMNNGWVACRWGMEGMGRDDDGGNVGGWGDVMGGGGHGMNGEFIWECYAMGMGSGDIVTESQEVDFVQPDCSIVDAVV
ncbi:hypothetical protein Tco_1155754 [Tanacetum coccineum]